MGVTSKRLPEGDTGAGKNRGDRPSINPVRCCARGSGARQNAQRVAENPGRVGAFPNSGVCLSPPQKGQSECRETRRSTKPRLRDSAARSVRGGQAALGPPSIRVPLNQGDTHADVPAESMAGASKGRHDEPAQATFNAHPTGASFGCGSIREGGADQSLHGHRRRDHRGGGNRSRSGNRRVGVSWRLRRLRQGLSPAWAETRRGLGA